MDGSDIETSSSSKISENNKSGIIQTDRGPMIDFVSNNPQWNSDIPRKLNKGVVGEQKSRSTLARIAGNKIARGATAALVSLGASSGIKEIASNYSTEDDDNRAIVRIVPAAEATGTKTDLVATERLQTGPELFDTVFHDLSPEQYQQARQTVDMYKSRIYEKSNYREAHQQIPLQYKSVIQQTARAHGLSEDLLIGIISVENGGGTDITNESSGARGVAQFLPDTARQYGLVVGEGIDERTNPEKSIAAAGKYLEQHKALFGGDEGLTIWSYHAGVGNVFRAMRVYFLDTYQVDIGDYAAAIVANDPEARESVERTAHEFMKRDKLDLYKLFSNAAVQEQVTSHLDDYSDSYPFAVVAASELLKEREVDLGDGLKVSIAESPGTFSR